MRYGTWEITSEGQNHSFLSDTVCTVCLYSMIPNVPNNNELWKPVWLTSFQKPQLQSVSIFFKFVHPNTVPPFVFAVVFFLRLTDFEKLCLCFTQFGSGSLCLNVDKFRDTASLVSPLSLSLKFPIAFSKLWTFFFFQGLLQISGYWFMMWWALRMVLYER